MLKRIINTQKRLYIVLLVLGIVFVLLAIPVFWFYYPKIQTEKRSEIAFLDVGQGDAVLIQTPFGQNILIDGGPDGSVIQKLEDELSWWDRKIDLMVLTHPHDDHVAGLIDVIGRFHVAKVLYTGVAHDAPAYLEWLALIKNRHIPLVIIDRPQKIVFGSDCFFDILYPRASYLGVSAANLNNTSIVAKYFCAGQEALLTGDAEIAVEKELAESGADLSARILKAGHHGSDTSSGEDFVRLVNPEKAILSVGADNKFGHPNLRVIRRLERLGAEVLRTDLAGTIRF